MATSTYFSIHGLPKLTQAQENWFLNVARVLPRSRDLLSRNLQIYKKIVHDRMNLETVSAVFNLSLTHLKSIVRKVQSAIAEGNRVFMFCDPPNFTAKKLYGEDGKLHKFDHERLADCLKKTEHPFLLTYDDCPQIRELYKDFHIESFNLQYGMNNCNAQNTSKTGNELFIRNY